MASLYFSMMSSWLRQFLARPISVLVSALIALVVSAPGQEDKRRNYDKWTTKNWEHKENNETKQVLYSACHCNTSIHITLFSNIIKPTVHNNSKDFCIMPLWDIRCCKWVNLSYARPETQQAISWIKYESHQETYLEEWEK